MHPVPSARRSSTRLIAATRRVPPGAPAPSGASANCSPARGRAARCWSGSSPTWVSRRSIPKGNREAQFAGLQRLLGGDVTVYAIDPRGEHRVVHRQRGGLGQGDRRTGGRMRVGTADTQFGGRGGSTMIAQHRRHGRRAAHPAHSRNGRPLDPERQQRRKARRPRSSRRTCRPTCWPTSRAASKVEGRHRIEVRVKRRGAKVSARRAFVVVPAAGPVAGTAASLDRHGDRATARGHPGRRAVRLPRR